MVNVPRMTFLMIDGQGDPNTQEEYADALEGLYTLLRHQFRIKGSKGIDYGVMPLEEEHAAFWEEKLTEAGQEIPQDGMALQDSRDAGTALRPPRFSSHSEIHGAGGQPRIR